MTACITGVGFTHRRRWETSQRYYEAWVDCDLFGAILVKHYGALGGTRGHVVSVAMPWLNDGMNAERLDEIFKPIAANRKRLGYVETRVHIICVRGKFSASSDNFATVQK